MADTISDQKTELWQKLHKQWLAEGKPGWVLLGGQQFKVLQPDDDNVVFTSDGGFDRYYGGTTGGLT